MPTRKPSNEQRWRMSTRRVGLYSPAEVRHWIEDYEEVKERKGVRPGAPLHILCCLADIERALKTLNRKEYEAVLLCGLNGISMRTAGNLLGVSAMTMSRRYRSGLENVTTYLNGAYAYSN